MTQLGTAPASASTASHPLEALSADELRAACGLVKADHRYGASFRISSATLLEPAKETVRSFGSGDPIERRAHVVVYDRATRTVHEVDVSITGGSVLRFDAIPGVQPPLMLEEAVVLADRAKADPRVIEALAKRGVTDLEHIQVDPWPAGNFGSELDDGRRFTRGVIYHRHQPSDNGYARPVENLIVYIDHDSGEVIDVVDNGVVPMPTENGNYDTATAKTSGPMKEIAPLDITQPDGPDFTVENGFLRWHNWQMRVSVHPISGLVLHQVGWEQDGAVRPILYRASLGEMVVPYGSTQTCHWWKNAFDAGEIGLGKLVNSLTLGCDCLGEIVYEDAHLVDEDGEPYAIENAVCFHEEDFGILWKHWDFTSDTTEVRRNRRLVVSAIATVGNYEYGFYWYFYLDGTIQLEIKMTGILQTQAIAPDTAPEQAEMIAPQLAAPHHQHLFAWRLDTEIDGPANVVNEIDVRPLPADEANPWLNAFDTLKTRLTSEQQAQRDIDPSASRVWTIESSGRKNRLGKPTAYKLVPDASPTMLAREGAAVHKRATFGTHHLWVTPFSPDELFAAGDYPTQHPGGDGLPRWTQADRDIEDTDVVVWHTVGATHIARPEDWPVMPVEVLGFTMKPYGFFDRNPALDVPPANHCD